MRPSQSSDDMANIRATSTELLRERVLGDAASIIEVADSADLFGCQLGEMVLLSEDISHPFWMKACSVSVAFGRAALTMPIVGVIGMSSKPQMRKQDAARCVASVATAQAVRDLADLQEENQSMDEPDAPRQTNDAISVWIQAAIPQQAAIGVRLATTIDPPKNLSRAFRRKLVLHGHLLSAPVGAGQAPQAPPAPLILPSGGVPS